MIRITSEEFRANSDKWVERAHNGEDVGIGTAPDGGPRMVICSPGPVDEFEDCNHAETITALRARAERAERERDEARAERDRTRAESDGYVLEFVRLSDAAKTAAASERAAIVAYIQWRFESLEALSYVELDRLVDAIESLDHHRDGGTP